MPQFRPMEYETITRQLVAIAEKVGKRYRKPAFNIVRDALRGRLANVPWLVRQIILLTTRGKMMEAAKSLSPALVFCILAEQSGNEDERTSAEKSLEACMARLHLTPGALEAVRADMLDDVKALGGDVLAKRYAALA